MRLAPALLVLCCAAFQDKEEFPIRRSRIAFKAQLLKRGGGGDDTEGAVRAALQWLARHQQADGSWKVKEYLGRCKTGDPCSPRPGDENYATGVTALAVLAILGAGHSPDSDAAVDGIRFGDVARKGLAWLAKQQGVDGFVGDPKSSLSMYGHALAALALVEAYAFAGPENYRDSARKALDFLLAAQNPGKGWRYSSRCGDNDTSVTAWCLQPFRAAESCGLPFPIPATYTNAIAWLDEATDPATGRAGYTARGTGKVIFPGQNEDFKDHETTTAMAVQARFLMTRNRSHTSLAQGCALLDLDLPKWDSTAIDYSYWHWASRAVFEFRGADSPAWAAWNGALKEALLKNQNTAAAGCKCGSWEPVDRWSGMGGRVYATAINALTLETYYRNVLIFGGK